ncbi:MAG: TATA-box-binding protein [Candidatus Thermoplasmatota archaeon]|nr:TATA-box-binding protein [Candidatus Thermoplasmatota archaeon]
MLSIKIQNIVATTSIAEKLDLNRISKTLPNTSYRPNLFPGLVLRIEKPKTAFLLFKSGKVVCTGAKNVEDIEKSMGKVCNMLKNMGFKVIDNPIVDVQNIVASGDLHGELNLINTALALGLENTEYEPEVFPGMVYRMEELGVVLLLFNSGKIVCTGAKKPEQVSKAVKEIAKELEIKGLLIR